MVVIGKDAVSHPEEEAVPVRDLDGPPHRILLEEPLFDNWWLGFSPDFASELPCVQMVDEASVWVAYCRRWRQRLSAA
jgi:hypothetical protein